MRLLFKLLLKLAMFAAVVMLSGGGLRKGAGLLTGESGSPATPLIADGAPVTKEESDLTGTVFKSAFRLVSGQASRSELSAELNEKLYGQRGDPSDMAELGIELVTPKGGLPLPLGGAAPGPQAAGKPGDPAGQKLAGNPAGKPGEKPAGKPGEKPGEKPLGKPGEKPPAGTVAGTAAGQKAAIPGTGGVSPVAKMLSGPELVSGKSKAALSEIGQRLKQYSIELGLVPVLFIGMAWMARARRRKQAAGFVPEYMTVLPESDSEKYVMKHCVQSLPAEEFTLLMALIYQRQGYRVSMSAGLPNGHSSRFKIARKAERILVQCHNFKSLHRVEVDLVRELQEAMPDANITGAIFIASCAYTWDARHLAKTKDIKLVSAKTLDILLTEARMTPEENLLAITPWLPKFLLKVEMTTPRCPECEGEMDEVKEGDGSQWLCNQRPECGGRRDVRKYRKGMRLPAYEEATGADPKVAPQPASQGAAPNQREPAGQPRSKEPAQRKSTPKTEAATPKPVPDSTRDEGKGTGAVERKTRSTVPSELDDYVPQLMEDQPKPPPASEQGEGAGRTVGKGFILAAAASWWVRKGAYPKPKPAKQVPIPADDDPPEKSGEAVAAPLPVPARPPVSQPVARTVTPSPAPAPPVRGTDAKKNGGLRSNVVEDFRRRGFRSVEPLPPKPKPAPGPERGAGAGGSPATPPKRVDPGLEAAKLAPELKDFRGRGFRSEKMQSARPKPAPGPACGGGKGGSPPVPPKRAAHGVGETKPRSNAA